MMPVLVVLVQAEQKMLGLIMLIRNAPSSNGGQGKDESTTVSSCTSLIRRGEATIKPHSDNQSSRIHAVSG